VLCVCVLALSGPLNAQPLVTGYIQSIPLASGSTALSAGNVSSFNRFRLTTEPVFKRLTFNVAYEHAATIRPRLTPAGLGVGVVPSGGEWLNLQQTIAEDEHVRWEHRFDRLRIGWRPTRSVELSVGRQAVSWGTTLFLTPADPFSPFSPADPFREFRAGVDAVRVRMNPSPLSEVDLVVRPTRTAAGEELTALGRGLMTVKNWELSGWGGTLYGDLAGAVAAAGALGALAVRGEAVVRDVAGQVAVRGTLGVDRLLQVGGRDLFILAEYQHDGLGAAGSGEYLGVVLSEPFTRGELQVLGRDETVAQASYQLHPLWGVGGLWLWNLNDRSMLLSPSVSYSASEAASVAGGVLFGLGDDQQVTPARPLPSEYGVAGVTAYLSMSWFF
jgi:hypothetical protein